MEVMGIHQEHAGTCVVVVVGLDSGLVLIQTIRPLVLGEIVLAKLLDLSTPNSFRVCRSLAALPELYVLVLTTLSVAATA
jgi:hypothetical protein